MRAGSIVTIAIRNVSNGKTVFVATGTLEVVPGVSNIGGVPGVPDTIAAPPQERPRGAQWKRERNRRWA